MRTVKPERAVSTASRVPLFDVVVIGAGIAGLWAAKVLEESGFHFIVYESAAQVGGTWRDNRYPGLTVDVPVDSYQLPFAPKYDWSRPLAPGPEIQDYLLQVTESHGLRRHI